MMRKMAKDTPPTTRLMAAENKKRSSHKPLTKNTNSIVEQLRQQVPAQLSKRRKNDEISTSLSQRSSSSPAELDDMDKMDIEFEFDNPPVPVYQREKDDSSTNDDVSETTENIDNINKKLFSTRVDLRIKVPPHTNPEEKTVQVLQELLRKLQSFDNKVHFAPWYENCPNPPLQHPNDFIPRPSELEKYFPRIFFNEEGSTWYSGARIVHSIHFPDLRQDMIRWLKREGHGLFERMLQVPDTAEIGWFLYSTWQMETSVLAQAIESTINMSIGLRWKQISQGTKNRLPPDQQVKALHVEVSLENRVAAQKALLAVYGRKNSGHYPNGIHLRFSLPIHAAHNLNSKAKLERLRARQQVWVKTYEKGFSWEISQLDHPIGKNLPTLRQALLKLMSTTIPSFPLFHSVDRSTYRESGICFQFIPDLSEEARMTISNLVPLMKYKYGPSVLKLFSPAAVERMQDCHWDPATGTVIGQYEDEITYMDEDDPMKTYLHLSTSNPPQASIATPTSPPNSTNPRLPPNGLTSSLMQEMDDDSVSTLGNANHQRWVTTPPLQVPPSLMQRPSLPSAPLDDASIGSISTLTTRLTTMESQYQQISGAVQDIRTMLAGLAQTSHHSNQDEPPTNATTAGQSSPLAGGGS